MQNKKSWMLTALLVASSCNALAGGPWVKKTGEASFSTGFKYEHFDEIYVSKTPSSNDPGQVEIIYWLINGEMGMTDSLTLGLSTGATRSSIDRVDGVDTDQLKGRADSKLYAKYQIKEGSLGGDPTITAWIALIDGGTYHQASGLNEFAPGDKVDGFEAILKLGQKLENGYSLFGDLGYRAKGQGAPDDLIVNLGVMKSFNDQFALFGRYNGEFAKSGVELNKVDRATFNDYYALNEDREMVDLGVKYTLDPKNKLKFVYSTMVDGSNTGNSQVSKIYYTYSF